MTVVVRPEDGGIAYVGRRLAIALAVDAGPVRDLPLGDSGSPARGAWRAWRALSRDLGRDEVVHLELGRTTLAVFWFGIAAMLAGRPVVAVLHDFPVVVNRPATGLIRTAPGWRDRIAHRVLGPLFDRPLRRYFRTHLRATVVLSADLVTTARAAGWPEPGFARHGADPPRATHAPSASTYVLLAGYLSPDKGLEFALDCWPDEDLGFSLKIAGAASRQHQDWLRAAQARIAGRRCGTVEWLGFVDDERFADLVASAALVLVPYERSNPVSGVVVRALVEGRPLLCTRVPATAEVEDGESGLVVDFGDVPAWTVAIEQLFADPALRDRLGAGAARRGADHTWRRHASDVTTLHRSVPAAVRS